MDAYCTMRLNFFYWIYWVRYFRWTELSELKWMMMLHFDGNEMLFSARLFVCLLTEDVSIVRWRNHIALILVTVYQFFDHLRSLWCYWLNSFHSRKNNIDICALTTTKACELVDFLFTFHRLFVAWKTTWWFERVSVAMFVFYDFKFVALINHWYWIRAHGLSLRHAWYSILQSMLLLLLYLFKSIFNESCSLARNHCTFADQITTPHIINCMKFIGIEPFEFSKWFYNSCVKREWNLKKTANVRHFLWFYLTKSLKI